MNKDTDLHFRVCKKCGKSCAIETDRLSGFLCSCGNEVEDE